MFERFHQLAAGMSTQGDLAAGGAFHLWKHPCTLELVKSARAAAATESAFSQTRPLAEPTNY